MILKIIGVVLLILATILSFIIPILGTHYSIEKDNLWIFHLSLLLWCFVMFILFYLADKVVSKL